MSEEIRGTLAVKAGNGKGFKIEGTDGWFNAVDNVKPFLAKMEKGDEVVVTYEKNGIARNVVKITKASGTSTTEKKESDVSKSSGTPVCVDCGCELKNDKYAKCWTCNKKSPTKSSKNSSYDNPEKTAQIQRGNSLNAAAAVIAGQQETPETLAEMTIIVAEKLLEWLRAE